MRSVVAALWFSVAATVALASDMPASAVAAETAHRAQAAEPAPVQAPLVRKPVQSVDRTVTDANLPAQTRLASTPPASPRSTAAATPAPTGPGGDPVLVAVAPQLPPSRTQGSPAQAGAQASGEEKHGSGSLTAAALLLMVVVMIRRRGAIRML